MTQQLNITYHYVLIMISTTSHHIWLKYLTSWKMSNLKDWNINDCLWKKYDWPWRQIWTWVCTSVLPLSFGGVVMVTVVKAAIMSSFRCDVQDVSTECTFWNDQNIEQMNNGNIFEGPYLVTMLFRELHTRLKLVHCYLSVIKCTGI